MIIGMTLQLISIHHIILSDKVPITLQVPFLSLTCYLKEMAHDSSPVFSSRSFLLTRNAPSFLTRFNMSSALSLVRLSWYQLKGGKHTKNVSDFILMQKYEFKQVVDAG